MAQIDKIQVGTTSYDILQSSNAIFTGTSNDTEDSSANTWTDVEKLGSSESNGSIFTKLSSMFKNIRFLYKQLGNIDVGDIGSTISEAIEYLNENKADKNHTHSASSLDASDGTPLISNTQVADSNHVPSSLLVKQMNDTLTTLNNSFNTMSTAYVASLGVSGRTVSYKNKNGASLGTITTQDTTYGAATTAAAGLMPKTLSTHNNKFLRADGQWVVNDSGTTYATFTSAAAGLVPAAKSGTTNWATSGYVLTGAGWKEGTKYNTDTNNTYANFTSAAAGLVPIAKSGSNSLATSGYVLTGAGWKEGTKYNTDTNTTYGAATSAALGLIKAKFESSTSTLTLSNS